MVLSLLILLAYESAPAVACPVGWTQFSVLSNRHDHRGCEKACRQLNASLACIGSYETNQLLAALIENDEERIWFGLYRDGNDWDDYAWTNGCISDYKNWAHSGEWYFKFSDCAALRGNSGTEVKWHSYRKGGALKFPSSTKKWSS
jgi:hypothetical protein